MAQNGLRYNKNIFYRQYQSKTISVEKIVNTSGYSIDYKVYRYTDSGFENKNKRSRPRTIFYIPLREYMSGVNI